MNSTNAPSLFGEWLACADGQAHYRLDGKLLCDSAAAPTGAQIHKHPPARPSSQSKIIVPYCARCKALNERRWFHGGVLPECKAGGKS